MKKFALALAAVAAMVLGFGGVANAYPPGGTGVTTSSSTVGPGGQVTVTAKCTAGETVTFDLEGSTDTATCETGDAQSAIAGTATGTVTAPTAPGTYIGRVTGSVSGPLGEFTVTVEGSTATPTATPAGGLPSTGSNGTSTMTFIAAGILVAGLGLFAVATLRRRQAPVEA